MGLTSILVTHDQDEALELADRVVVMNAARIEQVGSPRDVYDHPATAFVCEFMGGANRFEARIAGGAVELAGHRFPNLAADTPDGLATAYVRAHEFVLEPPGTTVGLPRPCRGSREPARKPPSSAPGKSGRLRRRCSMCPRDSSSDSPSRFCPGPSARS